MAPILCFTAEEAWSHRPVAVFGDEESVHLRTFKETPEEWRNDALLGKWMTVRAIRKTVLGAIEPYRADKTIGSSLEAHPVIYTKKNYEDDLNNIDLAEICITSQATYKFEEIPDDAFYLPTSQDIGVIFKVAEGSKCARCWKILPEVDGKKESLCNRCADAVDNYKDSQKAA